MSNFSDHIVNQRFKSVFQELEKQNLIKGKSDIAKKLGTYNHVINSILKGQRNITVDQLRKLFDIYLVNANFMFGLTDEMFLPESEYKINIPTHSLEERYQAPKNNRQPLMFYIPYEKDQARSCRLVYQAPKNF